MSRACIFQEITVPDLYVSPSAQSPSLFRMLVICAIGCALETYDFMIYALMAPYISAAFFPEDGAVNGLLLTFATFGIGYLARPFGGVLFGHIGDRKGRKKPFAATILLMALTTTLIGLLPGYNTLSIAPFLLLTLRLGQGVSMGGEVGGALTYVQEIMPNRRTIASCSVVCGMLFGLALGHLVHAGLEFALGAKGMHTLGWRLAFIFGGLLGVIGYVIRKHFQETAGFLNLQQQGNISKVPIARLFAKYPSQIVTGVLAITAHGFCSIFILIFIPTWIGSNSSDYADMLAVGGAIASVTAALCCLGFGYVADHVHQKLPFVTFPLMLLLGLPLTGFIFSGVSIWTQLALQLSSILVGMVCASSLWIFTRLFSPDVRYTGSGFTYNAGLAFGGGLTPFLATLLATRLPTSTAAGLVLALSGACGLTALWLYRRFNRRQSCHKPQGQGSQNETYDQGTQHAPNR
ncbi:MFS transporter [Sansalvadorimonas verongulae]|uniref:MFS transporter n=1 Tax=Sansalvadorimonas verongulae TaxID=2172824 RepID=UPI0012BD5A38|nr:MFS transporter [Sansalvadorimonas verongulae]MTI14240.1 MFS transporter [Sansalvadorimonas verongulae]